MGPSVAFICGSTFVQDIFSHHHTELVNPMKEIPPARGGGVAQKIVFEPENTIYETDTGFCVMSRRRKLPKKTLYPQKENDTAI